MPSPFLSGLCLAAALVLASSCTITKEQRFQRSVDRGRKLFSEKDYNRAALEYRNAVQLKPSDADAHYQLGLVFLELRDGISAAAEFRRASDLNPRMIEPQIKLAEILSATPDAQNVTAAMENLRKLLPSAESNADLLSTLAMSEMRAGELNAAERHLNAAVLSGPNHLKTALALAQLQVGRGDFDGAERTLRRAADSGSAIASVILGEFYIGRRRTSEARTALLKALAIDSSQSSALVDLAGLEETAGAMDAAAQRWKTVAQLPDREYKMAYAAFLWRTRAHDDAVRELERILRANPSDADAARSLMAAYRVLGRAGDLQRVTDAAIRVSPRNTTALLERARLKLSTDDVNGARDDVNAAIQQDLTSAHAHYVLALVRSVEGNLRDARQELTQAITVDPSYTEARLQLARLLTRTRQPRAAIDLLNATPPGQRQLSEVRVALALAYAAEGNRAEAAKVIADGDRLRSNPEFLILDAWLKLESGNLDGARTAAQDALQAVPADRRAMEILARTLRATPAMLAARLQEHAARFSRSAAVQYAAAETLRGYKLNEQASALYAAATSADSRFWRADVGQARLLLAAHKPDDARKLVARWIEIPAARCDVHSLLAEADERSGKRESALAHYRAVVGWQPDNVEALNNLAYAISEYANAPDEALKYAERAKELAPAEASIDDTLGWILLRKGLYRRASDYLKKAVATGPNATRHAHLAVAMAALHESKLAMEHAIKARELGANNPNVPLAFQAAVWSQTGRGEFPLQEIVASR